MHKETSKTNDGYLRYTSDKWSNKGMGCFNSENKQKNKQQTQKAIWLEIYIKSFACVCL